MLLLPVLAGIDGSPGGGPLESLETISGIALLITVGGRWLMPLVLKQVARTQNQELFMVSIVTVGDMTAVIPASTKAR